MDGDIRVTFETEQKYEMHHGTDYAVSYAPAASFRVAPYEPWHLRAIALQPHQEHLGALIAGSALPEQVQASGPCWTALADGRPIACAGFREEWPGRASCWAVLSDAAGRHMLAITRAVRRGIADHPAERIETTVLEGFDPGFRWARLLGFEDEGPRRRYCRGEDHRAFVLLKPAAEAHAEGA